MNSKALYIHIPFCSHICTYCDFYKMRAKDGVKDEYITVLIDELIMKKGLYQFIETIYIGGGTPSNLSLANLKRLLDAITHWIDTTHVIEWTIEMNPQDVSREMVDLFVKYGVNRISLGVQSFDEDRLHQLGRTHTREDIKRAIRLIHDSGIRNVSADLIYGLPQDTVKVIKRDLIQLINLGFTHISPYTLILEERTILYHHYLAGDFLPLSDEGEASIYAFIQRFLKTYGYIQYEVSNFARQGYESKHNLTYWKNETYVGLGASASYYIDGVRYTNVKNLKKYMDGVRSGHLLFEEELVLTPLEQMQEEMILGLRLVSGINLAGFLTKFGLALMEAFPNVSSLLDQGLLQIKHGFLSIPANKIYVSNTILINFI